jgi:ABC-type uncharacterized transport system permease subunit
VNQAVLITFTLAVVAYSIAATLFFVGVARQAHILPTPRWGPRALAVGGALHLTYITLAAVGSRSCPVLSSLPLGVSLTAIMLVALYLWLRHSRRLNALGACVAPLALTLLVGAQFIRGEAAPSSLPPWLLASHVTANLLGLSLFLMAGTAGVFYLIQTRRLKRKEVRQAGLRLLPLDVLARIERHLLLAGFPLLTFGIVSGAFFSRLLLESSGIALVRALLAGTAWVLLAGVLVLRGVSGWTGRRAAMGTIVGASCVLMVVVVYAIRPLLGDGT